MILIRTLKTRKQSAITYDIMCQFLTREHDVELLFIPTNKIITDLKNVLYKVISQGEENFSQEINLSEFKLEISRIYVRKWTTIVSLLNSFSPTIAQGLNWLCLKTSPLRLNIYWSA
jgi:hypothetical protein